MPITVIIQTYFNINIQCYYSYTACTAMHLYWESDSDDVFGALRVVCHRRAKKFSVTTEPILNLLSVRENLLWTATSTKFPSVANSTGEPEEPR